MPAGAGADPGSGAWARRGCHTLLPGPVGGGGLLGCFRERRQRTLSLAGSLSQLRSFEGVSGSCLWEDGAGLVLKVSVSKDLFPPQPGEHAKPQHEGGHNWSLGSFPRELGSGPAE